MSRPLQQMGTKAQRKHDLPGTQGVCGRIERESRPASQGDTPHTWLLGDRV